MRKISVCFVYLLMICGFIPLYADGNDVSQLQDTVCVSPVTVDNVQNVVVSYASVNGVVCDSIASLFSGGDGSSESPLIITNHKQLLMLMQMDETYVDGSCFHLAKSLDFSRVDDDRCFEKDPETGNVILPGFANFKGEFNGGYNTIGNFTLSSVNKKGESSGFFATIDGAYVKNLTLENMKTMLTEDDLNHRGAVMYMAALVGNMTDSKLLNCNVNNVKLISKSIKPNDIAILAGCCENSTITDCSVKGAEIDISAKELLTYVERGIGLLVGELNNSTIYGDKALVKAEGSINVDLDENITRSSPNIGGAIGLLSGNSYVKNVIIGSNDSYSSVKFTYSTPLKYSTVGGFIGNIINGASSNSKNILIEDVKSYTNVSVEWNNKNKDGYPLFVGGFAGKITSKDYKVRYRNINTYGNVAVNVTKPNMFMNALFMGGSIGSIYLGSVEQSNWHGSRVELLYGENIYEDTSFGQYIAAGGFVGIAGIKKYDEYVSRFEDDEYTTFWKCNVVSSDDYTENPKITREMQIDRYIGGEIAPGVGDGDYDTAEYLDEHYSAAFLADRNNYAHLISAPTFSNNIVNFNAGWMWLSSGVGGFAGWALADFDDCYVENAFVDGTLSAGGFAGALYSAHVVDYDHTIDQSDIVYAHYPLRISDCFVRDIYVTSNCLSGGFVGYSEGYHEIPDNGNVHYGVEISGTNAYNINGLSLKSDRYDNVNVFEEHIGGFIAQTVGNSISDALAIALIGIEKEVNHASGLGGLIGMAKKSKINNVMTLGAISVDDFANIGGVIGCCYGSTVSDATNLSFIYGNNAPYVGGVLGEVVNSSLSGLYNLGPISPRSDSDYYGGIAGYLGGDNELNGHFYSYAPIEMMNSAKFAIDMTMNSLKLIKDIVGAVKGDAVSICFTVAGIIVESVEYGTYKGARGKCGGLFGNAESAEMITHLSFPAKGNEYLYLWDQFSTEQDWGVAAMSMKACKSKTKDLLDFDFPSNSGLNGNVDNTFNYYLPWDCCVLYNTMKQMVKHNYK